MSEFPFYPVQSDELVFEQKAYDTSVAYTNFLPALAKNEKGIVVGRNTFIPPHRYQDGEIIYTDGHHYCPHANTYFLRLLREILSNNKSISEYHLIKSARIVGMDNFYSGDFSTLNDGIVLYKSIYTNDSKRRAGYGNFLGLWVRKMNGQILSNLLSPPVKGLFSYPHAEETAYRIHFGLDYVYSTDGKENSLLGRPLWLSEGGPTTEEDLELQGLVWEFHKNFIESGSY